MEDFIEKIFIVLFMGVVFFIMGNVKLAFRDDNLIWKKLILDQVVDETKFTKQLRMIGGIAIVGMFVALYIVFVT